ncbi:MAG: hypothetical protein IPF82_09850 [Blastocatellia bacterium]|nr:hypothetical protein [Blastocatellia bacterium]
MTFSLIRLASAPLLAFAVVASCFAQVELRTQTLDPELSRRTGADDGFGLVITASADGRGSLETCGCGRQPLGGLARRVGYEKAVLELTQGGAGLVRLDAGGAFDDTVDTGRNEVIPHIRSEWVLRGYIARDVAAINVGITDLRYLSQMNVLQDRDARVVRFPMLDRVISANVLPAGPGIVRFRPYIVREVQATRLGDKPVRVGIIGVCAARPETGANLYGYRIEDPIAALASVLPDVRKQSDVVVLLAYGPVERARAIAEGIAGFDAVLVANNFLPDAEVAAMAGTTPVVPVVLQTRSLTEVRGWKQPAGGWRFVARSTLLDAVIPSDAETLQMVYRARSDFIR